MEISNFKELQPDICKQFQNAGWNTLDQIRKADVRILAKKESELLEYFNIVHFAGLLLIAKDNLALFSPYEALALAKVLYESLETLILEKPENLIKKFYELKFENIFIEDIIRWQRSLDDYLFDVQNVWF